MQRQLVELDTVAGLAAAWTREEPAADRRLADRLANLRQTLEALLQEMAAERVSQLADARRGVDRSEPGDR
jgi:hypothetical protein